MDSMTKDPATLLRETEQALHRLNGFDAQEYREAMNVVPGLVEQETPIPYYLRGSQYNPLKAARRLASYWKYRRMLFSERWLLPMTQTGAGALSDIDIQLTRTGFCHLIPRENTGPLVVVDFSKAAQFFQTARANGWDTISTVERFSMYLLTIYVEEISKGTITMIHPVTSKERPEMEIRTGVWDMLEKSFPTHLAEVIVAQAYEDGKKELLDFLAYQSTRVLQFATKIDPHQVCGNSTIQTVNLLEQQGIRRDMVPIEIGGSFSTDIRVAQWTRARLDIETFLAPIPSPFPTNHKNIMQVFGKPKHYRHKTTTLLKRSADPGHQSEREYRMERNRVYARRNIQKGNLELLSLEGQKKQLELQNQALLSQNQQLERAIQMAKDVVVQHQAASRPAQPPQRHSPL
uniref:BZIP domain-containing protein n=1 Tax=Amphora coffeiformis TaxID=265554 RepID=A0A7S3KZQ8_9STRA